MYIYLCTYMHLEYMYIHALKRKKEEYLHIICTYVYAWRTRRNVCQCMSVYVTHYIHMMYTYRYTYVYAWRTRRSVCQCMSVYVTHYIYMMYTYRYTYTPGGLEEVYIYISVYVIHYIYMMYTYRYTYMPEGLREGSVSVCQYM